MFARLRLCEALILFLTVTFHSALCDVFHIVTTTNSPCPGEFTGVPCLTLQQYASNPSQSENVSLIVEPGMYYLSREVTLSNGYNFTMSSNNATVTCTSSTARFSFDTVENVHISGMTFQSCSNSAIHMTSVTEAYITNSSFIADVQQLNHGYGGAIYASSSTIIIEQSSFIGNSLREYVVESHYERNGGAIYASSSIISIDQSTFSGNSAASVYGGHGGAIYASSSTIIIDQSIFSGNA